MDWVTAIRGLGLLVTGCGVPILIALRVKSGQVSVRVAIIVLTVFFVVWSYALLQWI